MDTLLSNIEHHIMRSIEDDILKNKNVPIVHNHQPLDYLVDDCVYCKLYGNICCDSVTLNKITSVDKYLKIPLSK